MKGFPMPIRHAHTVIDKLAKITCEKREITKTENIRSILRERDFVIKS